MEIVTFLGVDRPKDAAAVNYTLDGRFEAEAEPSSPDGQ